MQARRIWLGYTRLTHDVETTTRRNWTHARTSTTSCGEATEKYSRPAVSRSHSSETTTRASARARSRSSQVLGEPREARFSLACFGGLFRSPDRQGAAPREKHRREGGATRRAHARKLRTTARRERERWGDR
jgi:hypothetical protein